jgi:hypothetical protein
VAGAESVAGSSASLPAIACSWAAASATVLVIGPAVSCDALIGRMPVRGTRPTVGRRPTSPCAAAGLTIEPEVSVPIVIAARPAAAAAPLPEDDPDGDASMSYGFSTWPPSDE